MSSFARSAVAGGLLVLALVGCSAQPTVSETSEAPQPTVTENADTPQQTQQKLVDLLDRTQSRFEGAWENHDSPSPNPCRLGGTGDEGVTFTGSRTFTGTRPDDNGINELISYFKSEGFEAGEADMGRFVDVLAVYPEDKTLFVRVSMGTRTASLSGQAACVPGDAYEELQRIKKEMGAGN